MSKQFLTNLDNNSGLTLEEFENISAYIYTSNSFLEKNWKSSSLYHEVYFPTLNDFKEFFQTFCYYLELSYERESQYLEDIGFTLSGAMHFYHRLEFLFSKSTNQQPIAILEEFNSSKNYIDKHFSAMKLLIIRIVRKDFFGEKRLFSQESKLLFYKKLREELRAMSMIPSSKTAEIFLALASDSESTPYFEDRAEAEAILSSGITKVLNYTLEVGLPNFRKLNNLGVTILSFLTSFGAGYASSARLLDIDWFDFSQKIKTLFEKEISKESNVEEISKAISKLKELDNQLEETDFFKILVQESIDLLNERLACLESVSNKTAKTPNHVPVQISIINGYEMELTTKSIIEVLLNETGISAELRSRISRKSEIQIAKILEVILSINDSKKLAGILNDPRIQNFKAETHLNGNHRRVSLHIKDKGNNSIAQIILSWSIVEEQATNIQLRVEVKG